MQRAERRHPSASGRGTLGTPAAFWAELWATLKEWLTLPPAPVPVPVPVRRPPRRR